MTLHFAPYRSLVFPLRVWVGFFGFFIPASLVVILIPGRRRRRLVAHHACRLFFGLVGIPVSITGLTRLPENGCFVVSNHMSYLDGPLLTAALPPRFGFVIKREAMKAPVVGWLLQRLGSEFVDRFDTKTALSDANRLIHLARAGGSLGVFPEGTFRAEPGLRSFHLGAFLAATRAGIPIMPLVIRGARDILTGESRWPRPGRVEIELLMPVTAGDKGVADARHLRDTVRACILSHLSDAERLAAQPQPGHADIPGTRESHRHQRQISNPAP